MHELIGASRSMIPYSVADDLALLRHLLTMELWLEIACGSRAQSFFDRLDDLHAAFTLESSTVISPVGEIFTRMRRSTSSHFSRDFLRTFRSNLRDLLKKSAARSWSLR